MMLEKFETFSTKRHGLEVCYEVQFKDMIGVLGGFYIGARIFDVVLGLSRENEERMCRMGNQDSVRAIWGRRIGDLKKHDAGAARDYIVVDDYIVYMDMIYHGDDEEKDKISFMMIDEAGLGKITFPFYENFLIHFYGMYGELLQTNTIEQEKVHEIALDIFQMIALVNIEEDEETEVKNSNQYRSVSQEYKTAALGGSLHKRQAFVRGADGSGSGS